MKQLHKVLLHIAREKGLDLEESALLVSRVDEVVDDIIIGHSLGTHAERWNQ